MFLGNVSEAVNFRGAMWKGAHQAVDKEGSSKDSEKWQPCNPECDCFSTSSMVNFMITWVAKVPHKWGLNKSRESTCKKYLTLNNAKRNFSCPGLLVTGISTGIKPWKINRQELFSAHYLSNIVLMAPQDYNSILVSNLWGRYFISIGVFR